MSQIQGNFSVNGVPFAEWFNNTFQKTNPNLFPYAVQEPHFESVMALLPDFTGKSSITIQEFAGHFAVMYNETGGVFLPLREYGGSSPAQYFFNNVTLSTGAIKASYNRNPNQLAGNQLKAWGVITTDADVAWWNGQVFPITAPQNVITASFKCDYYRFRGWGFNQLTWRPNYLMYMQPHLPKPIDDYAYEEFENLLSQDNFELACQVFYSFAESSPAAMQALLQCNYTPYGNLVSGNWYQYVTYTFVPRCQYIYNALNQAALANIAAA